MADNPWNVDSIEAFTFLKCPECLFDTKEETHFLEHAFENHPMSSVFFGKRLKEEYNSNIEGNESYVEDDYDNFKSENFCIDSNTVSNLVEQKLKEESIEKNDVSWDDIAEDNYENYKNESLSQVKIENFEEKTNQENLSNITQRQSFYNENDFSSETEIRRKVKSDGKKQNSILRKSLKQSFDYEPNFASEIEKNGSYQCSMCDYICKTKSGFFEHLTKIHEKPEMADVDNKKPLSCSYCEHSFSTQILLKHHTRRAHNKYLCSVCNKEFTRPQVLKEHVLTIHEGKKKPCSICNREFSTSKSLKWHILSVHEGKAGPHSCSICGKNCSSPSELKWHISGVHEKNKPFECSFCNIKFALRTTLTQHVQNRHTEKTPHPCPNCGKVYANERILRDHISLVIHLWWHLILCTNLI